MIIDDLIRLKSLTKISELNLHNSLSRKEIHIQKCSNN